MKQLFTVFNYALFNKNEGTLDVHIDGDIVDAPTQQLMQDWWGDETSVSFRSFRNQIEAAGPKTLNVYVNSGGGHVGDAMAMHDYLVELEAKGVTVNRIGRGIVASAATYLVMGKNSSLSENSFFMIHNISMVAYGDINQVENQVRAGRKFNDRIRDFYAEKTGKPAETITAWMNKEKWFTAQEAKDNGFVENVSGEATYTNQIPADKWPFQNQAILNTYNSFIQNPTDMKIDIQAIKDAVTEAVKNHFVPKAEGQEAAKPEDLSNAINTAIENGLKPVSEGLDAAVNTAVQNAIANKGEGSISEMIVNALREELKRTGEGTVAEGIGNAVTAAVNKAGEGFATKDQITKLEGEVANKLGGAGGEQGEKDKDRKVTDKKSFFQVGDFAE